MESFVTLLNQMTLTVLSYLAGFVRGGTEKLITNTGYLINTLLEEETNAFAFEPTSGHHSTMLSPEGASYCKAHYTSSCNATSLLVRDAKRKCFVRLGALAAASAYFIAAYGKHVVDEWDITARSKKAYETGKNFQYISALGLILTPFSAVPTLTGSLFTIGMLIFSGSCYYYGIRDIPFARQSALTPIGSMISVCAWLTFMI